MGMRKRIDERSDPDLQGLAVRSGPVAASYIFVLAGGQVEPACLHVGRVGPNEGFMPVISMAIGRIPHTGPELFQTALSESARLAAHPSQSTTYCDDRWVRTATAVRAGALIICYAGLPVVDGDQAAALFLARAWKLLSAVEAYEIAARGNNSTWNYKLGGRASRDAELAQAS